MRKIAEFHEYYLKREHMAKEIEKQILSQEEEEFLYVEGGSKGTKQVLIQQTAKLLNKTYIFIHKTPIEMFSVTIVEDENQTKNQAILHFDQFTDLEIQYILENAKGLPKHPHIVSTHNSGENTIILKKSV